MGETVQLVVVLVLVALAAIYAGRRLLLQLTRSEDEAGGCSGCALNPAMQEKLRRQAARGRKRAARSGKAPPTGGPTPPGPGARIVQLRAPRRS